MTETTERRTFGLAVRQAGAGHIEGLAVPYDRWTQIGGPDGFRERFAAGAFRDYLRDGHDVVYNYGHDRLAVMGRRASGTLEVEERADGVWVRLEIPDTQLGRDMRVMVERGDVGGHSVEFLTESDEWDHDTAERTVVRAAMPGVALTHSPAYEDTTAAVRSRQSAMADRVLADLKRREAELRLRGV